MRVAGRVQKTGQFHLESRSDTIPLSCPPAFLLTTLPFHLSCLRQEEAMGERESRGRSTGISNFQSNSREEGEVKYSAQLLTLLSYQLQYAKSNEGPEKWNIESNSLSIIIVLVREKAE